MHIEEVCKGAGVCLRAVPLALPHRIALPHDQLVALQEADDTRGSILWMNEEASAPQRAAAAHRASERPAPAWRYRHLRHAASSDRASHWRK